MAMTIQIDYIPDEPHKVGLRWGSGQYEVTLPGGVMVYLYRETAEALRDKLVASMGAPDGYMLREDASTDVADLEVPTKSADAVSDDPVDAYKEGYATALEDAAEALKNG